MSTFHSLDTNQHSRSAMIVEGMLKRAIHPWMKACVTAFALRVEMGYASGHCVNMSTHIRCVSVGWREWSHMVDVYCVEPHIWCKERREWDDCVSLDIGMLALDAGVCPPMYI